VAEVFRSIMNELATRLTLVCAVSISPIQAAGAVNSQPELPGSVRVALNSLLECARLRRVDNHGSDHFVYCNAPVEWVPYKVGQFRRCLLRYTSPQVEVLPSYRVRGGVTYSIAMQCSQRSFLTIEIEYVRGVAWVGVIGQSLP
jgi:hypothetical protein